MWPRSSAARSSFFPIAVTWYGLSAAAGAYGTLIAQRPELVTEPFLLLWQRGFAGSTPLTFSVLAAVDGALISLIIALSLALHYKADVRDPRDRVRTLLKESEVRGALARAQPRRNHRDGRVGGGLERRLAPSGGRRPREFRRRRPEGRSPTGGLRRIDLPRHERSAIAQEALTAQLSGFAQTQASLTEALGDIAQRLASIPTPAALGAGGTASLAVTTTLEEQERLLRDIERLLEGLQQVKKAQQVTAGSVTLQTDALQFLAKALVLASERVQEASQALGDVAAPGFVARRLRPRRVLAYAGTVVISLALVAGTVLAAPRVFESPADRYAREVRLQAQTLVGLQQLHLVLPPPRSAANDITVRDAATSLEDAATRADQWLDTHAAPPETSALGASLRGVTAAAHRAARGVLAWIAARPGDSRTVGDAPPASVLADLAYAETLQRDLNVQLGFAR